MSRGIKTRHVLGAVGRVLSAPVNAFRVKMPSDAALDLTPAAQCRWADGAAAELGRRLRSACAEATLWRAEAIRMNRPGAGPADRLLAKSRSSAGEEWERYRLWLVSAHERLAAGAPGESVASDWIARRGRLSTIEPRYV